MENIESIPVAVVTAQLELVRSWSTLLLVATGCHVSYSPSCYYDTLLLVHYLRSNLQVGRHVCVCMCT